MRRYYDVGYDLWCCSGVSITACDSTLGCQSRFVTLPWPVGYGLWRCPRMSVTVFDAVSVTVCDGIPESVGHGLWRGPEVRRSRSVMGSQSLSVTVCDGVMEFVGHGLWGGGKFLPLNTSTLSFRSCFTKQDWKSKKKKQRNVNDTFDNIKRKKFFVASSITRLCKTSGRLATF
jgi:hypothetical protein